MRKIMSVRNWILFACVTALILALSSSCVSDDETRGADDGASDSTGVIDTADGGRYDRDTLPVTLDSLTVMISEINTANTGYKDEFGGDPNWVEFYNPHGVSVDLKGYGLSGSRDNYASAWTFGSVVLSPKEYLTVFMSGRDIPNRLPAGDSIDIMKEAIGQWTWADGQATPVAGGSTAEAKFSRAEFSGTLTAADNPELGWTSAAAMLVLKGWDTTDVVDMSRTDRIALRGFVTKGAALEVRLAHIGVADYQAWPALITGTGAENDLYEITLPPPVDGFPDLANIYGIRFSNAGNFRGTIDFRFDNITAYKKATDVHSTVRLSTDGGRLYLIDNNGNARDSAVYPAAARGLSYARDLETGEWSLSKPPTPGGANSAESYTEQVPPPPVTGIPNSGYSKDPITFTLPTPSEAGVTLACDLTGAHPTPQSQYKGGDIVTVERTSVMRCAQFKSGAYASEPIMRTYIIDRLPNLPIVSIAVDPYDMFDNTYGLYSTGPSASGSEPYYGANYWSETELPAQIDFFENGATHRWNHSAGLRIFGNWSRMFAKKSVVISFREEYGASRLNYRLFPDHPELTRFKHFILRNNGNNFEQDYIRDMLMTQLTDGLGIDYQKGRAAVVFYNGEYFGIHNLRERGNSDYFETNYDISEDDVDLVKAGGEVSRGSDADYQSILRWLESLNGMTDENVRELDERLDVDNFTRQHQARIYYHDRDWPGNNMKHWRARSPQTKWKFLMYDTDHGWGSHGQWNQEWVSPLEFATAANGPDWPNPPRSTLILRKLLENENYKHKFINTFSLMMATYFSNDRVDAKINALMSAIESEIEFDRTRWDHNMWHFEGQLNVIRDFNRTRTPLIQRNIEEFFGLSDPVDVTLEVRGAGKVYVDGMLMISNSATFKAYPAVPMTLRAEGAAFTGWSDGVTDRERTLTADRATTLVALF